MPRGQTAAACRRIAAGRFLPNQPVPRGETVAARQSVRANELERDRGIVAIYITCDFSTGHRHPSMHATALEEHRHTIGHPAMGLKTAGQPVRSNRPLATTWQHLLTVDSRAHDLSTIGRQPGSSVRVGVERDLRIGWFVGAEELGFRGIDGSPLTASFPWQPARTRRSPMPR